MSSNICLSCNIKKNIWCNSSHFTAVPVWVEQTHNSIRNPSAPPLEVRGQMDSPWGQEVSDRVPGADEDLRLVTPQHRGGNLDLAFHLHRIHIIIWERRSSSQLQSHHVWYWQEYLSKPYDIANSERWYFAMFSYSCGVLLNFLFIQKKKKNLLSCFQCNNNNNKCFLSSKSEY